MRQHPTPEILDRFFRGELPKDEIMGVVSHLVRGCRFCQAAAAPMTRLLFELGDPEDEAFLSVEVYEPSFERAYEATRREVPRHRREVQLVNEANALLASKGLSGLHSSSTPGFSNVVLCLAFIRRSHTLRHESPSEMLQLARLAVLAASRLDSERDGAGRVNELRIRALVAYANAQRINGDLAAAERSLAEALHVLDQGMHDPLLSAHVQSVRAAVLGDQRRFSKALELLEEVAAICSELGEYHQAGRAAVQRGLYTGYAGEHAEAVRLLRSGLELIDEAADPQLALAAIHNIAWFLMEDGDVRGARKLLWENQERYELYAGHVDLIKRTWLEGRIAAGLGKLDRAAALLSKAMHSFEEAELGYQEALAALDLAAVWMRQGHLETGSELIERAAETFAAIGITREAVTCLRLLQDACKLKLANAAYVQDVSTFFRRLEHDPTARFQQR